VPANQPKVTPWSFAITARHLSLRLNNEQQSGLKIIYAYSTEVTPRKLEHYEFSSSSDKVTNTRTCILSLPHVSTAGCLIKHGDSFTSQIWRYEVETYATFFLQNLMFSRR